MQLVDLATLLKSAQQGHYAVGAFTFTNAETIQAIVEEAGTQRSPALLMIGPWEMPLMGTQLTADIVRLAAQEASVPVCLHLDHATELQQVQDCLAAGFSSVMMDASAHEFETNVAMTRQVVDLAHPRGVSVEGELGAVGRGDGWAIEGVGESTLTDPARAAEYVERTGVDALAVSIGNGHGIYTQRPQLDFERLAAIRDAVDVPLVLHGGSGTPLEQLQESISLGICKVNVASELSRAFLNAIVDTVAGTDGKVWWTTALTYGKTAMQEVVARWMGELGCAGRV